MKSPRGTLIALHEADTIFNGLTERRKENDVIGLSVAKNISPFIKNKNAVIEIITTESEQEEFAIKSYRKAFKKLGFNNVLNMRLDSREAANDEVNIQRLESCNVVVFACHHFLKLSSIIGGTTAIRTLKTRFIYDPIIIAGVNAGASALSNVIINTGDPSKAYLKGEMNISIGFGFVQNLLIDAESDSKSRLGMVVQAIAEQPGTIYIGLPESTGIVVKGSHVKMIGTSSVMIIDGCSINNNNIASIKCGMPISVGNLVVHLMAQQDVFNINTREFEIKYEEEFI